MTRIPLSMMIASTVPFVLLSLAISTHILDYFSFDSGTKLMGALLIYVAVFTSFLGGIHWGLAVSKFGHNRKVARMLIAESLLPVIVAWGVLFFQNTEIQLLVLALLYAFMWAVDSLLYNLDIIPQWFFNLRCIATPIVIVSLYVAYFSLI